MGSGNAALCAAISARESGASVLVLEKAPKTNRGGNSFFTDGAIRFAYGNINNLQKVIPSLTNKDIDNIHLPTYTKEDYYKDIMRVTKNESNPFLANMLVNNSYLAIMWLKEQGVEFELNENQYFRKGETLSFWGGLPVKTVKKGIGLVDSLFRKAQEIGIEFRYNTMAVELIKTKNQISGIYVRKMDEDRGIYNIDTNSIILACGGFEANKEERIKFLGKEWEGAVVRGSKYNTGDGIRMALKAGAQREGQYNGCHAHTTDYNAPKFGDFEKPGDIYKKSSYPLGLIINIEGKRFVDEGADFRNYTYAKYGKEILKQPNQIAFQIYDNKVRSMLRKEYDIREATVFKAKTIEELAKKTKVNKDNLLKTIEGYNYSVQDGSFDPSVRDGKKTYGIIPPKSNWALKFEQPPFYAYPVTCGITFTFGGIKVNDKGEVIGKEEEPITGLYAAGEIVGGLFRYNYPGGSGLMSGTVFGWIAGKSATSNIIDH